MNTERKNTLVISFTERNVIRPTPYEIHEWISEILHLDEHEVEMIQLNGLTRQVFIKCFDKSTIEKVLKETNGEAKFLHSNGQVSTVMLETAGIGTRMVKVFNLPMELPTMVIQQALQSYGKIVSINNDTWGPTFRYKVCNGVRSVRIMLTKHIPSYLVIGGYRALISYENQPITCAQCTQTGHMRNECPRRKTPIQINTEEEQQNWAQLVKGPLPKLRQPILQATEHHREEDKEISPLQEERKRGEGGEVEEEHIVESESITHKMDETNNSEYEDVRATELEEHDKDKVDVATVMECNETDSASEEQSKISETKKKETEKCIDVTSNNSSCDFIAAPTGIATGEEGIQIRPYVRPSSRDPRLEKRRLEEDAILTAMKSKKSTSKTKTAQTT